MRDPGITLVVAMTRQRVIGARGKLPWHLPADLRHFRRITMGKPIVMGRRTHESIGRALPGRENIVVSQNPAFRSPGCMVVHSLEQALDYAQPFGETMIIGGATLYAATLPLASRMHLTEIHANMAGDIHFPAYEPSEWRERQRTDHAVDDRDAYPYSFVLLERVSPR